MAQALYRQYRPKTLDGVVGQDHITTTLKNALKSGKISHAYLFTGPRGVGKTSVARILAHEVNQFSYDQDNFNLDIIEIDAASNRRIDEIRDLRDKVHIAPSSGKYKVYIIDEVHMLTKEAFNALLKTLEEPPAHVIFILATTESHKLPETIISRTQRFSFKPIDNQQIVNHLKSIAKQEKIKVDDEALQLIAQHSEGSFRDSLSLLDQASSVDQQVTSNAVRQLLGIAPNEAINQLINSLSGGIPKKVIEILQQLEEQGYQAASIAKQLGENLRHGLVNGNNSLSTDDSLKLLRLLITVPASPSPDKLLEIILLDVAFNNSDVKTQTVNTEFKPSPQPPKTAREIRPEISNQKNINSTSVITDSRVFTVELWPDILNTIKGHHNTLYGILRMSQPSFENNILTLSFKFAFHQKRIGEPKMQQLINSTFVKMNIEPVKIEANVVPETKPKTTAKQSTVDVAAISNIFGDPEVLES